MGHHLWHIESLLMSHDSEIKETSMTKSIFIMRMGPRWLRMDVELHWMASFGTLADIIGAKWDRLAQSITVESIELMTNMMTHNLWVTLKSRQARLLAVLLLNKRIWRLTLLVVHAIHSMTQHQKCCFVLIMLIHENVTHLMVNIFTRLDHQVFPIGRRMEWPTIRGKLWLLDAKIRDLNVE